MLKLRYLYLHQSPPTGVNTLYSSVVVVQFIRYDYNNLSATISLISECINVKIFYVFYNLFELSKVF